jgi:hypothetical protein
MKNGYGFEDSQLAPDKFVVSFHGNADTKATQASDFTLLRATQLTLEHGFAYFAITDITNTSSARPYVVRQQYYADYPLHMGLPPPTPGIFQPYQGGYIVEYEQPATYFRPGQRFWIQCFKTKPEKPFTYDAAPLEASLKKKYKLG